MLLRSGKHCIARALEIRPDERGGDRGEMVYPVPLWVGPNLLSPKKKKWSCCLVVLVSLLPPLAVYHLRLMLHQWLPSIQAYSAEDFSWSHNFAWEMSQSCGFHFFFFYDFTSFSLKITDQNRRTGELSLKSLFVQAFKLGTCSDKNCKRWKF